MKKMVKVFNSIKIPAAGLLLLAIIFSSCTKDNVDSRSPAAGLMAFNLAIDQPSIGFSSSGRAISNAGLNYPAFTGNYIPTYIGTSELRSYDYNNNNTLATSNVTFADSMYYSAFLIGNDGQYENLVVQDDFDMVTPVAGKAWVRYVNAIPDSSSSNIMMGETSETAAYKSVSDFEQVNTGDLTISIKNGTNIDASRTITVNENKIYTILMVGMPNATDSSREVMIRFIENGTATN